MSEISWKNPLSDDGAKVVAAEALSLFAGDTTKHVRAYVSGLKPEEASFLDPFVKELGKSSTEVKNLLVDARLSDAASGAQSEMSAATKALPDLKFLKAQSYSESMAKFTMIENAVANATWRTSPHLLSGGSVDLMNTVVSANVVDGALGKVFDHNQNASNFDAAFEKITKQKRASELGGYVAGIVGLSANVVSEATFWKDTPRTLRSMTVLPMMEMVAMAVPKLGMIGRAAAVIGIHQGMRFLDQIETDEGYPKASNWLQSLEK